METAQLLCALCAAKGGSGAESTAAQTALSLTGLPGGQVDALGNAWVTFGAENGPHLLLEAHIDQIGMIVTHIDKDGFVRFAPCGGLDVRTLPGSPVEIYAQGASEPLPGVVSSVPPHLNQNGTKELPDMADLAVDAGLLKEEAEKRIHPGDRMFLRYTPKTLLGTRVVSGALDDRAGGASLILCAQMLKDVPLSCRVTLLFATREEVGGQGAKTAAFGLSPDAAICVDVGFADQPGAKPAATKPLGSGAMIGTAPILNRAMVGRLASLAEREGIPYTWDVMGGSTGTDCDEVAVTKSGVPTALLSIPQRSMHTAAEIVDTKDVEAVARLMAAYAKEVHNA